MKEIEEIKKAIHQVISVTSEDIASSCRQQDMVYARMIFAYHCIKCGVPKRQVCNELNRSASTVGYYLSMYEADFKYNAEFRYLAENVKLKLNN